MPTDAELRAYILGPMAALTLYVNRAQVAR